MIRCGLTDEAVLKLTAWALAGYRRDPEWDDLLQVGWIGAWKAAKDTAAVPVARTRIVRAARWAVLEYRGLVPNRRAREAVSLAEWRGTTSDFSDRVLRRLERKRLCGQALAAMSDRERRYVRLWIGQGIGQAEIAAADGITLCRVSAIIRRGLKKARLRLDEEAAQGTSPVSETR